MTSSTVHEVSAEDAAAALRHGLAQHRAGNVAGAVATYRQLLVVQPRNADAWHLCGIATQQLGDLAAAERMIRQADELHPGRAPFLGNLGNVCRDRGDLDAAEAALRQAVAADDSYAPAHNNLGHVLRERGKLAEAVGAYRRATEVASRYGQGWRNLAVALAEQGETMAAIAAFWQLRAIDAADADDMNKLGVLLQRHGETERAIAVFTELLDRAPSSSTAHLNLGSLHKDRADGAGAIASFRAAVAIDPEYVLAHRHLGFALLDAGDLAGAEASFRRAVALGPDDARAREQLALLLASQDKFTEAAAAALVPSRCEPGPDTADGQINAIKIAHDLAQLRYLRDRDRLGPALAALLAEYERHGLAWLRCPADSVAELTPPPSPAFRAAYNKLLHIAPAPPVATAIDPGLDVALASADYQAQGVAVVDRLLSEDAVTALRDFCLESTIWTLMPFPGELSTNTRDGFGSPLLFQIAAELRRSLPAVFGTHRVSHCWAYRYDGRSTGIEVHADDGAVSVNLWITPDAANRAPGTGGLMLWPAAAPPRYFDETEPARKLAILKDTLRATAPPERTVPYQCNRAVIFRSDTIHRTADFDFGEAYAERRMNVTLMFGERPRPATRSR